MKKYLSPYWLWLVLSLPAFGMLNGAIGSEDARIFHRLVHPSGEFAARFTIIAMIATPLTLLLPGWRGPKWLLNNRRYFGVAAFGYALLHAVFYVLDKASVDVVISELDRTYIWTGWVAFVIFIPLAATSMDFAIRTMGYRKLKAVQKWTYVAAVFTLVHWAALHDWGGVVPALVQFSPLIALTMYRLWWNFKRGKLTLQRAAG